MNRPPGDDPQPLLATAEAASGQEEVVPPIPPAIPRRGSAVGRLIGRFALSLTGWKVVGGFPDLPKLVIIVAPHTSNWDFVVGFSAYLALDLHCNWFGKHTLFVGPFGAFFRHFGGIPVHRQSRAASEMVDVHAETFRSREQLLLAIAPEGTRKRVTEWKSGFHRIAHRAGVPIVPVALDYRLSRVIVGAPVWPTGDWDADFPRIRALYDGITPKHPQQF